MDKTVFVIYVCMYVFTFTPGNPICSHSNQIPLRFGPIVFLPLLQQASDPELLDVSEGFPKLIVLVGRPAGG